MQSSLHLRFFNFSFSPSASPSRSELTNPCIGIPGRAASRSNRSGACSAPSLGLGAPRCSHCSPAPSARVGEEGRGGPNLCGGLRWGHGAGGPHIIAPQPAHGLGLLGHRSLFGVPSAPHQALLCTSTSPYSPKGFPLAASPPKSPHWGFFSPITPQPLCNPTTLAPSRVPQFPTHHPRSPHTAAPPLPRGCSEGSPRG